MCIYLTHIRSSLDSFTYRQRTLVIGKNKQQPVINGQPALTPELQLAAVIKMDTRNEHNFVRHISILKLNNLIKSYIYI